MKKVLVVAGASGDLFAQKVAPALAWLYSEKRLEEISIIGLSRKKWDAKDFRTHVATALESREVSYDKNFLHIFDFKSVDIEDERSVAAFIEWMAEEYKRDGVHFSLHLSVSPKLFEHIFREIASAEKRHSHNAKEWLSLIVEKPYGDSEVAAQKLDDIITPVLGHDAVYRIDHYLTKETIQDILAFRFANKIFESAWDSNSIAKIRVHAYETATVAKRAAFYDSTGALRDVGQNHLLQMLAAVTMDEPISTEADSMRMARANVIRHLAYDKSSLVIGQYASYKEAEGVAPDSHTDTFFRINASLETERWIGVQIELSAGKALDRKETYIEVEFKPSEVDFSRFQGQAQANMIRFSLYPKEEVLISIFGKKPGLAAGLRRRTFGYSLQDSAAGTDIAYAAVLDAALDGDKEQFAGKDEVHAAWRFIDSIRADLVSKEPIIYEPGIDPKNIPDMLK